MQSRESCQQRDAGGHDDYAKDQTSSSADGCFTASKHGDSDDVDADPARNHQVAGAQIEQVPFARGRHRVQAHSHQNVQKPAGTHDKGSQPSFLRSTVVK